MIKNAVGLFTICFLILLYFLPSFTQMQDLKEKNRKYLEEIKQLKQKNTDLQVERYRLENDPAYLEKVAREKMGLVKEGEMIYRMSPGNEVKK